MTKEILSLSLINSIIYLDFLFRRVEVINVFLMDFLLFNGSIFALFEVVEFEDFILNKSKHNLWHKQLHYLRQHHTHQKYIKIINRLLFNVTLHDGVNDRNVGVDELEDEDFECEWLDEGVLVLMVF